MVNGIAAAGPTPVHAQNYQATPPRPSQDNSGMYRPPPSVQPTQSVISMDETVPYSRGIDRSEVLSSKFTSDIFIEF
jgi:hypothetical protein